MSKDVSKNTKIGEIQYEGLPALRAGQAEIDVELKISEEQIMTAKVQGKHPNAEVKELVLSLDGHKHTDEEIEALKAEAAERHEYFNYILEVEQKIGDAVYAIKSSITMNHVEESHRKFMDDFMTKWNALKEKHSNVEDLKKEVDPMLEEAQPILAKIAEAKTKALSEYDTKNGPKGATGGKAETAESTPAPDDL